MHLTENEKTTIKFLWDQGFTLTLEGPFGEPLTLVRNKCPKCGALVVENRLQEQSCLHCEWGN